jgi:hypothetical protein
MTRAIRVIASAAFVTALTAGLGSVAASEQTPEPDPGTSETKETEQTTDDSTGTTTDGSTGTTTTDSTGAAASDTTGATPTAAKTVPIKPAKRILKPFEPTEKIEAESVISFPANI